MRTAAGSEVAPRGHPEVQAAVQRWVDGAVSKTINLPSDTPFHEFAGYEAFRGDLVLAYFVDLESGGRLSSAEMRPLRIRRFRLEAASAAEVEWLRAVLDREGARLGSAVRRSGPGRLALEWAQRGRSAPGSARPERHLPDRTAATRPFDVSATIPSAISRLPGRL
ncbi:MAG TPA: hypothetical protein VMN39_10645 [Longimicrobiaceae bacterium]|nr:hypothetical protein [Longimicrobiaceae bacterium]